MKKIVLALAAASALLSPRFVNAQFADNIISYASGTGFAAGFTNPSAALGAPASGNSITPFAPPSSKSQLVSIGTGGEITLQLSAPIVNNPNYPYGVNFNVFANEFFVENKSDDVSGLFDHAASIVVQVSSDDSTWYTLNPSLAPQAGALFPTYGNGNPEIAVNPVLTLANFEGLNLSGVESLYGGSAGGTGYDLAWAQDGSGNSVDLASADYVRIEVQSGVLDLDAISAVSAPDSVSTLWGLVFVVAALFGFRKKLVRQTVLGTAGAMSIIVISAPAATTTLTENFAADPLQNGWRTFGDSNLFQWDSTNQVVDVTWDSSQSNSYYYLPLHTVLTRNDDFSISFDLQISQASASGYGFELALGLLNIGEAKSPGFQRSTGENSPDLVEFDYFPDVGYGPTVWPLFVDGYSDFNYNGSSDYAIYAPTSGIWYRIVMTYTAANQSMVTTMLSPEQTVGITIVDPLASYFADFRVDAFSISSYQDDGEGDSIYAQGMVSNIVLTFPTPPPIRNVLGSLNGGQFQLQFRTQTNWSYILQRTSTFQCWTNVTAAIPGNGTNMVLQDTNPPSDKAFYRVSASMP